MFYLINKPKGISSYKLIIILRKKLGIRKIGHAGTLDPMGQGLMILAVGKDSTKKISSLVKKNKIYEFEITLGKKTATLDETGEVIKTNDLLIPNSKEVKRIIKEFVGIQMQTPPQYSAIKVGGKRAYKLARKNINVELKSRKIQVYFMKLISYKYPKIMLSCKVSTGTYVRVLADEIGEKLGTYGYVSFLKRVAIGDYKLSDALNIDDINKDNYMEVGFDL